MSAGPQFIRTNNFSNQWNIMRKKYRRGTHFVQGVTWLLRTTERGLWAGGKRCLLGSPEHQYQNKQGRPAKEKRKPLHSKENRQGCQNRPWWIRLWSELTFSNQSRYTCSEQKHESKTILKMKITEWKFQSGNRFFPPRWCSSKQEASARGNENLRKLRQSGRASERSVLNWRSVAPMEENTQHINQRKRRS